MERHHRRALEFLEGLGRRPAVPFHEGPVARYVVGVLREMGHAASIDAFGNVLVRYRHPEAPAGSAVALVAHMDHPGFEVTELRGDVGVARALGRVPEASLRGVFPLRVLTPEGPLAARTEPLEEAGGQRRVLVRFEGPTPAHLPAPAVFDLVDYALEGEVLRMRALDDLAGCAAILAALEKVALEEAPADVTAVFTRAEEGGLFGARLMAQAGTLPRGTAVVSVESSPLIPGVAQGDGPVVRTGDALTTFDEEAEAALKAAVERLKERDPAFRAQRRLMSGGVCEASAFAAHGYAVTGVAFPLSNYHNATTSVTDPDGGVDAEYIRLSDFLAGVDLLAEAAANFHRAGEYRALDRMGAVSVEVRRRLEGSADW